MKSRLKRQRYVMQPERSQSQIAESVLHEESDNFQYAPYSKSFAYTQLFNFGKEAVSLSMWNEHQDKEKEGETEAKPASQMRRGRVTVRMDRIGRQRQSITEHGSSTSLETSGKHEKGKSMRSRTRCAISLISPKLDDQNLQPKPREPESNKSCSYFLSSQMRQSVRDRKKMIIKKIKRDPGLAFDSISLETSSLSHMTHLTQRKPPILQEKKATYRTPKTCSQVDLKFVMSTNRAELLKGFVKIQRADATLKVSRLTPLNNGHIFRGRRYVKTEKSTEGRSRIECSEQFRKLKCLLQREKLKAVEESYM